VDSYASYQKLIQPSWAPPAWVFGPVWTLLYAIIAVTYGTVFYKVFTGELPWRVAVPFALNLVFNFAYTWLQFGLKNNYLASIDVVLVVLTLVWAMFAIYPHIKWVALANIPYLIWVAFAAILQLTITYLNR
jgi:tryptophan-rich sensory protein